MNRPIQPVTSLTAYYVTSGTPKRKEALKFKNLHSGIFSPHVSRKSFRYFRTVILHNNDERPKKSRGQRQIVLPSCPLLIQHPYEHFVFFLEVILIVSINFCAFLHPPTPSINLRKHWRLRLLNSFILI